MSSHSTTHSLKSIFEFDKLVGSKNYFIWSERMTDVLIREKLWDVVSGHKPRPADPDLLAESETTGVSTIDQATTTQDDPDEPTVTAESSSGATASKKGKKAATDKAKQPAASEKTTQPATVVTELPEAAKKQYEKQDTWDSNSKSAMSYIRGAINDEIIMRLSTFKTAHELWDYLKKTYGKVNNLQPIQSEVRSVWTKDERWRRCAKAYQCSQSHAGRIYPRWRKVG
jgi:hypothetical protein